MYEFNGWAVVEADEGTEAADDELMDRLMAHIAGLPESTRDRILTAENVLNGFRSITLSGLRNHPDPFIVGVFHWLAEQSHRAYGLLYVRDDSWGEPDAFNVWKLERGKVTFHNDPFFTV